MSVRSAALAAFAGACAVVLCGCTSPPPTTAGDPAPAPANASATSVAPPPAARTAPSRVPPTEPPTEAPPPPRPSETLLAGDGEPRDAELTIREIGISGLAVEAYRGTPDDGPGTRIQDRGIAASPYGRGGTTGPGGVGNYVVTAHRLSSTRAFLDLPDLRRGDEVQVVAGGQRFTYRITETRRTSFRSARSLRQQSAAVPGRPGVTPTKAMITLSTCRTPEDRAEGNSWTDEFGNPENRIDKVGELVSIEDA